jgi:hypothetical protein
MLTARNRRIKMTFFMVDQCLLFRIDALIC